MLKVTIVSPEVREMKGVAKASGKPYHMGMQTGYIFVLDKAGKPAPYPEKFDVMLDRADDYEHTHSFKSYPAGDYILHPASIYLDGNGRLAVAPKLVQQPAKS